MLLAWALMSQAAQAACAEPPAGSEQAPALSPPLSQIVTGTDRLQFHSAPDSACAMKGAFIIPKDEVIAYAQTRDGWSSVMYLNPKTGGDVSGWVKSARLRTIGTVGPKQ
jgi:hypothetical protein